MDNDNDSDKSKDQEEHRDKDQDKQGGIHMAEWDYRIDLAFYQV